MQENAWGDLQILGGTEDRTSLSRAALATEGRIRELVGQSEPMRRLCDAIWRVGHTTSSVLLIGESGTGKELVARSIHNTAPGRDKPFVPVDCSTLVATLAESELFGHVRGAFTGADYSRLGLLKTADEGTVFLDEIGEMPTFLQAKLLRVLQEKEVRPVGSTARVPIRVRIIAATHKDLEACMRAGTFRQDLFFRLNVVQIRVPPLRERKSDIPVLVEHFLEKLSPSFGNGWNVSDDALQRLIAYDWPGNVRELQNAVERAVALSSTRNLSQDDFASVPKPDRLVDAPEIIPLAELERRAVIHVLRETKGNIATAARLLGIGKTTLYRKLKEYGIPIPQGESRSGDA